MGEYENALNLFDMIQPSQLDESEPKKKGGLKSGQFSEDVESTLSHFEKRYENFRKSKRSQRSMEPYALKFQQEVIETFQKLCVGVKKCENCGSHSPGFRKDGFAKIFQKPLAKKYQKEMTALRHRYKVSYKFFLLNIIGSFILIFFLFLYYIYNARLLSLLWRQ